MPLDSVCLTALKAELEKTLVGMKIDKVQQPERDAIVLALRGNGASERLLICAGTGNARLHLTKLRFENPQSPPMFCMLLRKHLTGARIKGLFQPEMERILRIDVESMSELGEQADKSIYVELLGSAANIVLVDGEGIITDCMRRISGELEGARRVLPGLYYHLPDRQEKLMLTETDLREITRVVNEADGEKQADKWLLGTFGGISPLVCRELSERAYGRTDIRMEEALMQDGGQALIRELSELRAKIINGGEFMPCMLTEENGRPKDFSFIPIRQYGTLYDVKMCSGFSDLLDEFYAQRDKAESMRRKSQSILKSLKNQRDRTARRLAVQKEELLKTADRETLRRSGDIIMANMYAMEKRMTVLRAVDFYSEDGRETEIKLDPRKTPQENAARYYKEYTKAKNAEAHLTGLIASGEKELSYLNSVMDALERAETERDVLEIREELQNTGFLRRPKQNKREKHIEGKPMHFVSGSGLDIWVGRNNMQNERLTHKLAAKQDIWLHVQKLHGSHAVISLNGGEADDKTIEEAAVIAAYYSQGRDSSKVAVDYTRIKYVKRQPGGNPGMVIYTDYKTINVTPNRSVAERLRADK